MSCTKQTVEDPKQDDTKRSEGWWDLGACHERTRWAGLREGELLFISNGYHRGSPVCEMCRHVKEGILSRPTMRMLWVAVLVFCRRFSCQARSTFLQVMTFQFAKNHLSGLRGGLEKLNDFDAIIWWEESGMWSCHHSSPLRSSA